MGCTNEGNPADQARFAGGGVLGDGEAHSPRTMDLERALADERRRSEQLSLALHESEENVQRNDALMSMATHDLRSPLGSIQLNIQSILHARRPVPRWIRTRLSRAEELVRHAAKLISDLLTFERSRVVTSDANAEEMDLHAFVRETIGLLEEQIRAAKCSVYIQCEEPIVGRWDKVCLGQIISNLVGNAIKFGAGKPLEITIGRSAGGVRIVVSDHGVGLAERDHQRIFERFEQLRPTTSQNGVGLGLWIVAEATHRLKGSVRLRSAPGEGSTFIVELPGA
jgi:signal transduction histidine kinase